jgi:nucleoid-associated protein YgaU
MNQNFNKKMKLSAFVFSLVLMTACSSSQVDDANPAAPETAAQAQPGDATTDAVPGADGSTPSADPNAVASVDPNAVPAADPSAPAPVADASLAQQPAPEALAANPVGTDPSAVPPVDASAQPPVVEGTTVSTDSNPPVMDPAPIADASEPSVVSTDDTYGAKKHKKHKKHSAVPAGDGVAYQVKKGDTLMKIAFEQYGDLYRWKEIYEANRENIQDPNHVPPGTQLTLNGSGMVQVERNGERYMIKHGETLGMISSTVYGTPRKWKKLWENNRQLIKDPNKIYAGFYLYYQPEGRLTHDANPADPSTSEAPVVESPDASKTNPRATVPVAQTGAPAANMNARTPASANGQPAQVAQPH